MSFPHLAAAVATFTLMVATSYGAVIVVDGFEPDDSPQQAGIRSDTFHTFHDADDEDWIAFGAAEGQVRFEVSQLSFGLAQTGITIELWRRENDGSASFLEGLASLPGLSETLIIQPQVTGGHYFARVLQCRNTSNPACAGSFPSFGAEYAISIFQSFGTQNPGTLRGTLIDANNGQPVGLAAISTSGNSFTFSGPDGRFVLQDTVGTYTAVIANPAYAVLEFEFQLVEFGINDVGVLQLQSETLFASGFE